MSDKYDLAKGLDNGTTIAGDQGFDPRTIQGRSPVLDVASPSSLELLSPVDAVAGIPLVEDLSFHLGSDSEDETYHLAKKYGLQLSDIWEQDWSKVALALYERELCAGFSHTESIKSAGIKFAEFSNQLLLKEKVYVNSNDFDDLLESAGVRS